MEIPKPSETLLAALTSASETRTKLKLETVQTVFLKCFPHWQGAVDRRERLRELVDELVVAGLLRLPADQRKGWERTPLPSLPKWVVFVREAEPTKEPFDHRAFPWVQELSFVAGLRALPNARDVLRIHDFLKNGGAQRPVVPVKERSYEVFGDEKRLDQLRKSQLFLTARLNLELLRCRDVPASLPCIPAPDEAVEPWLIIENEATFHSFCRLNRILNRHQGIILGSGLAVLRAVDFLAKLLTNGRQNHPREFHYFGDLDEEGIRIPHQLDRKLHRLAGIRVRPATRYYEWLLAGLIKEDYHHPGNSAPAAIDWFSEPLQQKVRAASIGSRPLPQERVGWEILSTKLNIDPEVPF